jgi:iron complex transport system substrate-binding protein
MLFFRKPKYTFVAQQGILGTPMLWKVRLPGYFSFQKMFILPSGSLFTMRILSLHPAATELAFALGAGNMLVGRTDLCDYPEAATSVPSIGMPSDFSYETMKVFEPDLILISKGQEQFATEKSFFLAPESLEDLYVQMRSLGQKLGKEVEADLLTHELQQAVEHIKQKTQRFHTLRVYCERECKLIAELITLAGGEPHCGKLSIDELQKIDPQLMIIPGKQEQTLELAVNRDGWSELHAVQHERVFLIDDALLRPTPRVVQGAKQLAKILHGVEV